MTDLSEQGRNSNSEFEGGDALKDEPDTGTSIEGQARLALWVQLPRRIILLLIAFGLAIAFIRALQGAFVTSIPGDLARPAEGANWDISIAHQMPVDELLSERMPNTLRLLGMAMVLALLLAVVPILVGILIHWLEEREGLLGSIFKGLGRLWMFGSATAPTVGLGLLLLLIFAVQLKLLPIGGTRDPSRPGEGLQYILLPSLTLALFPALVTAQAVTRAVTLPHSEGSARIWLTGLLKALGVLMGQVGGLLSAVVLVEVIFSWPGAGRMFVEATIQQDFPLFIGILSAFAGLILWMRLAAELFRWLERLVSLSVPALPLELTPWRRKARAIWVILMLAFLIIPLIFSAVGVLVSPEKLNRQDLSTRNEPPSAEHPLGTDALGRDLLARLLRGSTVTLGMTVFVALLILLPAVLGGALTGFLAARQTAISESISDLLLLPADVLLFVPVLPGAIVLRQLLDSVGWAVVGLSIALMILPRAVRAFQLLWLYHDPKRKWLALGLISPVALLLGMLFTGFGLVVGFNFLGFGLIPPTPSIGLVLSDGMRMIQISSTGVLAVCFILWLNALSFYASADALIGFFSTKEVMARVNE